MSEILAPRLSLRIGSAAVAVTGVIALAVSVLVASQAHQWLPMPFGGVPHTASEAARIFVGNLRLAGACWSAALVAHLRLTVSRAPASRWGPFLRGVCIACDSGLVLAVVANLAVVGTALGAYRQRMLLAVLPHGPFELAAFCLALSFYVRARQKQLPVRAWVGSALTVVGLLAVASVLETFAWLG